MLRPGWFPEFSPAQQKVFDSILEVIAQVFQQYNYEHIRTPAVEPVDILKRGWDIVDKQVYGLYGLAQGNEDTKDYALHFDLTIPLARYILDHRQELSFPFKRYQMQPVWRGEKTKRGRYKEFRQFDVDVVWPSESKVGVWYDTETLAVLDRAMQVVCETFDIQIDRILKISHIGVAKEWLTSIGILDEQMNQVLFLLDDYYKFERPAFENKLIEITGTEIASKIFVLIDTKDTSILSQCTGYDDLTKVLNGLEKLGVNYEYDICIVRGHGYYRGMVCEWFQTDDIALGSLAAGGRYDNVTDFIDPKQSFSGVGTSLGRFVYLAIDKIWALLQGESYLFLHFEETFDDILSLYTRFLWEWKVCELYPIAAKFGKQLEYADKKAITHVVIVGSWEKEQGQYAIKHLASGIQTTYSL